MRRRTTAAAFAAAALIMSTLGVGATAAPAAAAACKPPDGETVMYAFSGKTNTRLGTDVASAWIETPAKVSYSKTTSATVSASVTATVSAEAGVVFVKASASLGITVGYSYSWTDTFTYSKAAVASGGDFGRLRLYRDAVKFTTTKYLWKNCAYSLAYTSVVTAPTKNGDEFWIMEYKN